MEGFFPIRLWVPESREWRVQFGASKQPNPRASELWTGLGYKVLVYRLSSVESPFYVHSSIRLTFSAQSPVVNNLRATSSV